MKTMLKWSIISLVVASAFMVVLLALGYLLKQNEIKTTALKLKLDKAYQQQTQQQIQHQAQQPSKQQIATKSLQPYLLTQSQILVEVNNLIQTHRNCTDNNQCLLVDIAFADRTCQLAINQFGAAKLSQLSSTGLSIEACQQYPVTSSAQCKENVCQVSN